MTIKTELPLTIHRHTAHLHQQQLELQRHHHHHYHHRLHQIIEQHQLNVPPSFHPYTTGGFTKNRKLDEDYNLLNDVLNNKSIKSPSDEPKRDGDAKRDEFPLQKPRILKENDDNTNYLHNHHQHLHAHSHNQQVVQVKNSTHVITSEQHRHDHHHHQHISTTHGHIYRSQQKSIHNEYQSHFKLAETQRSQIRFILMAAFAYILSPIDLVPELIFGVFGIIDDIVFLFMCLFCVSIVLLYPLFREARRALVDKFALKRRILVNKTSKSSLLSIR